MAIALFIPVGDTRNHRLGPARAYLPAEVGKSGHFLPLSHVRHVTAASWPGIFAKRYPKDRYQTEVESNRHLQSVIPGFIESIYFNGARSGGGGTTRSPGPPIAFGSLLVIIRSA